MLTIQQIEKQFEINDHYHERVEATTVNVEWPEPLPLTAKIELEPYPLDALPYTVRAAVVEVQRFTKAPISLVGSSAALAALSLAIQVT